MIKIDISVGDTVLMGKFKNKKVVVKSIGKDEYGMPTINGRGIVKFRPTEMPREQRDKAIDSILSEMG
tara:strand:- start:528 stop:731 length:204 start_codon:yes stop_codon:yes gene_type:complete